MQVLMLIPLGCHMWNVKENRKHLVMHGAVALFAFLIAFFMKNMTVNALILFLCMILDMKSQLLLLGLALLIYIYTIDQKYALVVWVIIELIFVLHENYMIHSYEQQMQEYQNKVFDRQVKEVENMFMTMRGWRHDFHHHLQSLKVKLNRCEIEESLHYLDELEQELRDIRQLVESGNTNMDAILNSKLSLAVHHDIQINVKAKVPERIPISDTDVCALLGNLVDNAVEACEKVKEDKFIRMYIGKYKGQLYISCTNSTAETVRKLDEEYITNKRGNHGHGLKRMYLIVDKYDGMISRKNEPGVFTTEILLPM